MSLSAYSAAAFKPLLEECGYRGMLLKEDYAFGATTIPLAGFATKPWDFDSACIAVAVSDGDSEATAYACRNMGAPVVWVRHSGTVDWWMQHAAKPTLFTSKSVRHFESFVRQHKDKLSPASVYRGKTIARVDKARQLDFVDTGLLPLLREEAGKKLHDLVEDMTRETLKALGGREPDVRNVFTAVFRLIAGKILKDKGVYRFKGLDLTKPVDVLTAVERHYNAGRAGVPITGRWKTALTSAASFLGDAANFGVVSPETLAYVYEHTLVTKDLRKKLGIHATPPWLVDYMVWRLDDWIREIPDEDRHVFEPACGHAPFLLSAMRLLRLETQHRSEAEAHNYLKTHIHGLEIDDFAREIARLSLTLADIPSPNGWDLQAGDMFSSEVLMREAAKCRILLANPPYEAFGKSKELYADTANPVTANTKATEMLLRTLPHLPAGAVFSMVVPYGVLHDRESRPVRERLLADFDLSEISVLPDNVFENADHEVTVLIGRRKKPRAKPVVLRYRRVREQGMEAFKERLVFSSEQVVLPTRFAGSQDVDLRIPELDEVWAYLSDGLTLGDMTSVAQGLSHKAESLPKGCWTVKDASYSAGTLGFSNVDTHLMIYGLPKLVKLNTGPQAVLSYRNGRPTGSPQVLLNYARVARKPWKLKATLDPEGHALTSRFSAVRPKPGGPSPLFLWALLNSPVANAFAYCHLDKRDILVGAMRMMPFPSQWSAHAPSIEQAAWRYRQLATQLATSAGPLFEEPSTPNEVCQALKAMDAAVLRAYDLPPRLERQLLDLFTDVERKGVGCDFRGYYPPGFTSCLPLHMIISDRFQRAAADVTAERLRPGESEYVREVLNAAAAGMGEE